MAVLQKGKSIYPFWGESLSLITGLDPLGLQTTSEATYAAMLPGISNLTNRLRYYGFYCWLLNFYFKKEKKGNSTEQYRFIRRAELMIALIMQSERNDVQQITGSNFATNLINTTSNNYYDLAEGADKDGSGKDTYWKYSSGAFGQYYYGAMRAISLVVPAINKGNDNNFIFQITHPHPKQKVSGKQLADAFDSSLTPAIKDLFYNNIKKGKLYKKDIPFLVNHFAIEKINPKSEEWKLYSEMLLDKDDPSLEIEEHFSFHRKETISYLIDYARKNNNDYDWYSFLSDCYQRKLGTLENPVTETNIGWYCYRLNEYWQFACGTIFWACLQHLYSFQQDQYLPGYITKFSESIVKAICKQFNSSVIPSTSIKQLLSQLPEKLDEEGILEDIDTTSSGKPAIASKNGFLLLFLLFTKNREQLFPLKEFMSRKSIIRDGNMVDGLLFIHHNEDQTLQEFVEQFILRKIIYRHQMVALRKMGNGSLSTHKFFIEEQYIRFIDTFPPRNTSPRMYALRNLLYDLGIINSNNSLTLLHKKMTD